MNDRVVVCVYDEPRGKVLQPPLDMTPEEVAEMIRLVDLWDAGKTVSAMSYELVLCDHRDRDDWSHAIVDGLSRG